VAVEPHEHFLHHIVARMVLIEHFADIAFDQRGVQVYKKAPRLMI
jgi:hypothetical protein